MKAAFLFLTKIAFLLFPLQAYSVLPDPDSTDNRYARKADIAFGQDRFEAALEDYLKAYNIDPLRFGYYVGLCYLKLPTSKDRAIPYFQKAAESPIAIPETFYYLGDAYRITLRFDDAITAYQKFLGFIKDNKAGMKLKEETERKIQECKNGKILVETPVKVQIKNMGTVVNSPFPDYSPVVSSDGSTLIFTSRREGTTGDMKDEDGLYFEDIYMAKSSSSSKWTEWSDPSNEEFQAKTSSGNNDKNVKFKKAKNIGNGINTSMHDAAIALSADGQKLFIYRNSDIYISTLDGKEWETPQLLNANVNSAKGQETSITLSADEQMIYFSSTRKGGLGGRDIYKAVKMANGEWGPAENLGTPVNTPMDEDAPFIHADGRTLYFASKGHNTMGEYDIFKTEFQDGKWKEPLNLGYPINTPANDIFYSSTARGAHAYFSSDRDGNMDIYQLFYEGVNIPLTEVQGLVVYGDEMKPMGANIKVTDEETGKLVGMYNANNETGRYVLIFPPGKKYKLTIDALGFDPHEEIVYVPNQTSYYQMFQKIHFMPVRDTAGKVVSQKVAVQNAFFDVRKTIEAIPELNALADSNQVITQFMSYLDKIDAMLMDINIVKDQFIFSPGTYVFDLNKTDLKPEAKKDLDNLYLYLLLNPELRIEVSGYTDNVGAEKANLKLSLQRAYAVARYLEYKGISSKRLKYKGYGESRPIASNDTEEGRAKNRRTEIKLLRPDVKKK